MKKQIYLFSVIFFALTIFFSAPARADNRAPVTAVNSESFWNTILDWLGFDSTSSNTATTSNKSVSTPASTALPINNGVIFLLTAGVVIGTIALDKTKKLKPVAIKA